MADIIPIAAHAWHWKRLYEAAMLEVGGAQSLQRIADAHNAVLDRIKEDNLPKPTDGEQLALRSALAALTVLRGMTVHDLSLRESAQSHTYHI